MEMTIVIAGRSLPYTTTVVYDCTIGNVTTWRASPADAFRDAARIAGFEGAYVIPRSVPTAPLYTGARRLEFTMVLR